MIIRGTVYFGNGEYFCLYRAGIDMVFKDKAVIQFTFIEDSMKNPGDTIEAAQRRLVDRLNKEAVKRGIQVRGIDIPQPKKEKP